ncbi:protein phosphatase [Cyclospora cayetanensis]|uniref:Protein phosphatase n=1 Tax=Cyclospora cayetanensis TaxID=88456 RepID=A0A1D3DAW4_9EIME|nr:protein phosphatase [Cyclospora cayetanensis]
MQQRLGPRLFKESAFHCSAAAETDRVEVATAKDAAVGVLSTDSPRGGSDASDEHPSFCLLSTAPSATKMTLSSTSVLTVEEEGMFYAYAAAPAASIESARGVEAAAEAGKFADEASAASSKVTELSECDVLDRGGEEFVEDVATAAFPTPPRPLANGARVPPPLDGDARMSLTVLSHSEGFPVVPLHAHAAPAGMTCAASSAAAACNEHLGPAVATLEEAALISRSPSPSPLQFTCTEKLSQLSADAVTSAQAAADSLSTAADSLSTAADSLSTAADSLSTAADSSSTAAEKTAAIVPSSISFAAAQAPEKGPATAAAAEASPLKAETAIRDTARTPTSTCILSSKETSLATPTPPGPPKVAPNAVAENTPERILGFFSPTVQKAGELVEGTAEVAAGGAASPRVVSAHSSFFSGTFTQGENSSANNVSFARRSNASSNRQQLRWASLGRARSGDRLYVNGCIWEVNRFAAAAARRQGFRASMEDEELLLDCLPVGERLSASFYGVYDGHASLVRAFLSTDRQFLREAHPFQLSGCAAVTVVLMEGLLFCANCGDSRACLSRGGIAVDLSRDHKPDRADELARILAAGGHLVIAEPEVRVLALSSEDEFLLIACDGLFDVMSSQEAISFVRGKLQVERQDGGCCSSSTLEDVANALIAEAIDNRRTRDNVTCVIVDLRAPLQPPSEQQKVQQLQQGSFGVSTEVSTRDYQEEGPFGAFDNRPSS